MCIRDRDYLNDDRRTNLYKVYSALINLRNNYETFHASNFGLDVSGFMKKINLYHTSMDAFIVGNFGVTQSWTRPNFSRIGYWYDYFSGDSINVTDVTNLTDSIILAPGDFRIYTTSKLPLPEPGILLDVEQIENQIPVEYSLEQNYPNPFNPSTVIRYRIIKPAQVSLKIYDVLGSEIKTLVNKEQVNGVYEVDWNGDDQFGNNVSTGVYFYKINAGDYTETRKMMLIK